MPCGVVAVTRSNGSSVICDRIRTNISKVYVEPEKAPYTSSDPEEEKQNWRNHAA